MWYFCTDFNYANACIQHIFQLFVIATPNQLEGSVNSMEIFVFPKILEWNFFWKTWNIDFWQVEGKRLRILGVWVCETIQSPLEWIMRMFLNDSAKALSQLPSSSNSRFFGNVYQRANPPTSRVLMLFEKWYDFLEEYPQFRFRKIIDWTGTRRPKSRNQNRNRRHITGDRYALLGSPSNPFIKWNSSFIFILYCQIRDTCRL